MSARYLETEVVAEGHAAALAPFDPARLVAAEGDAPVP